MFVVAHLAQLAHLAQYAHLVVGLHGLKVVEGCRHTGGVGVIGINDKTVVRRNHQLRAVVAGHVGFERVAHLLFRHGKEDADGGCCQHVFYVVGTYEVCVDVVKGAILVAPVELKEGAAARHLAIYIGRVGIGLAAVSHQVQPLCYAHEVGVVVVNKHGAVGARA